MAETGSVQAKPFDVQFKDAKIQKHMHTTNNKWLVGGSGTLAVLAVITALAGVLMLVAGNGANLGALSALGTVGPTAAYITLGVGSGVFLLALGFILYSAYKWYSEKKERKEALNKEGVAEAIVVAAGNVAAKDAQIVKDVRNAVIAKDDKENLHFHWFAGKDGKERAEALKKSWSERFAAKDKKAAANQNQDVEANAGAAAVGAAAS